MATVERQPEQQAQSKEPAQSQSKPGAMERPASSGLSAREFPGGRTSPLGLMRRLSEDMDRLFGSFFGSSPWTDRRFDFGELAGWPEVEVYRRENKLVVRADVPGLGKDDVNVEIKDNELTISGERRHEEERSEREYFRSERTYGSFCRTIALPEGANVDTASASFQNGVLQVEIEVPPEDSRGRKIEVRESSSH